MLFIRNSLLVIISKKGFRKENRLCCATHCSDIKVSVEVTDQWNFESLLVRMDVNYVFSV